MLNLNSLSRQIGFGYALILLIFIISLILTLSKLSTLEESSNKTKDLRNPTTKASLMLLNGINHSLAALRGGMLIGFEEGGERFTLERNQAWTEEITPSINEMNILSKQWTNPENIERLVLIKSSLKQFESYQNQIEEIANSDQNKEASSILFKEAAPKAAKLMSKVTAMIELEKTRSAGVTRKNILGILSDIRGSFAICLAHIRAYILSGDEKFKVKFEHQWKINNDKYKELALKRSDLNLEQLLAFEEFSFVRSEFSQLPGKMFQIRASENWDKAKFLLKNKAAPLAFEIKATLRAMIENQFLLQNQDFLKTHEQLAQLKWLLVTLLLIGSTVSIFVGLKFIQKVKAPLDDIINIIIGMSKGQFNLSFNKSKILEINLLSESVQLMKGNFLERNSVLEYEKTKLKEEDWVKSNLTKTLKPLSGHIDLESFSAGLLNALIPKIKGLVGVFYIKKADDTDTSKSDFNFTFAKKDTDTDTDTDILSQIASYAYSLSEPNTSQNISIGEGLIGQCALTQKILYISDTSDNDISINSTFIKTQSKHIVLLPISYEGEILAVLEIGAFEPFLNKHKSLIEQISQNSGIILKSVLGRIETEKLLAYMHVQNLSLNEQTQGLVEATKLTEAANKDLAAHKAAMDQHSLVSVTDIRGIITYANDKFCAISGYKREELIGENHRLLNSRSKPKDYWRDMFLKVSKGGYWHDEVCNIAKDGHYYWVDTTIGPLFDNNNKLIGYTSIRTDISHQKEIISSLAEAKKQADVANESKTDFLANMSHEIRTPMNGVIGMTNLLLDTQLNQEQHDFAKTVKNSAESLLTIINDILDFSKVEAGMLDLECLEFDLGQLLHDVGSAIAFRAHEKGLELICPANLIQHQSFKADPGRIRQILNNLIGNAIKFTEQGEVSVYCKVQAQSDKHTQLLFEVTDTGIGLTEEEQNKLFDRFSQADGSTTRKYGGTGLGLSISKQLVELMHGEIGINSNKGEGSTFWFTLKLDTVKSQLPSISFDNLKDQKILVVDDNYTNRVLLEQLLSNWQVEHTLVASGEKALEKLIEAAEQGNPYHIAILDMQMPKMDGFQLGEAIKADDSISSTNLVMLTSQGQRGDVKKSKTVGFSGYLSKPIEQTILYNSLIKVASNNNKEQQLITAYSACELSNFNARVLVVEDNAVNQKVAQGLLKKFGLEIELAANGEEALRSLESLPFDLVFMDCQMPVMDGYEASRQIRAETSKVLNRDVPIIAMTANTMQGDREKCLAAGMSDFIAKPINPIKVQEALKIWLPKGELEVASITCKQS